MKIACAHWRDIGQSQAGACALGKFGGRPSRGTCHVCLGLPLPVAATSASATKKTFRLKLSTDQRQTLAAHQAICSRCEHHKRFTRLTVHCRQCGCAGLSLLQGRCPLARW